MLSHRLRQNRLVCPARTYTSGRVLEPPYPPPGMHDTPRSTHHKRELDPLGGTHAGTYDDLQKLW